MPSSSARAGLGVGCGQYALRRVTLRRNVTEEAEGVRLVSTLLVILGEAEGLLGTCERLLGAAGQEIGPAQMHQVEGMAAPSSLRDGLLQQRQGLGNPPSQGIGGAQGSPHLGKQGRNIPGLAEFKALFEHRDAPVDIPFVEVEVADPSIRPNDG